MADACRSRAPHAGHEWVPVGPLTGDLLWCDGVPEPDPPNLYAAVSLSTQHQIAVAAENDARALLQAGKATEAAEVLTRPEVIRAVNALAEEVSR